ncbi:N-acetylmuramoyl-L-alanine amidase family protein [Sphingomonas bacterium]|uniref:N-acetylmuramoyl-L-alanine amidase family protein n=1 Tax=Sphingomonas bacterium TaxID=1895847 RepID=UPI001576AC41|nr:N-acetylmuramoyl-L-alanine amidase [Sphingomonas bacterium]
MLAAIGMMVAAMAGPPARAATVTGIAVGPRAITIRFDDAVAAASSASLSGPDRIAVDVTGLDRGVLPAGEADAAHGLSVGRTAVGETAVRETAGPDGATRLVFRFGRAQAVTAGRFEEGGRTLVLALRPRGDAAADVAPMRLDFFPFSFGNHPRPLPRARAFAPVPAVATSLGLPRIQGDASRPLVVIDPGHGGFDPGAISAETGLREKDMTLKIARAIRDELLRSGRVRVALTRDDDRYLVLRERFGIARRLHADLFISIHCDSVSAGEASGASVYTLSEVASDKEAARLALRENKADTISGVDLGAAPADVSSILIDLTQRETMNNSADFARLLGREGHDLVPMKPNFHRMASLMVLKAPDMPSILFETGYLSNPRDAAFLDSGEGRERIAQSIRRAVDVHFARRIAMR